MPKKKNPAAVLLGRKAGKLAKRRGTNFSALGRKGGLARKKALSPKRRQEIARDAGRANKRDGWGKPLT